jgi:CheY-like chemotaxis protein
VFRADQQRKILVIDDSEIVLEVTRAALESAGHHVVTHDRAAGCVALILQQKPDLVLMDVNMPHLGGDTIVGVLGKAQPVSGIVVLLYSSLPADILRVKAEAVGAQGFIQKTGDHFALVREVNRWLKRSSGQSSGRMRTVTDAEQATSNNRQPVAADIGAPSSGKLRAAAEFGAGSSGHLRVGPDLSLPSSDHQRVARDVSSSFDQDAHSSGTRAAAQGVEIAAANSSTRLSARTPSVLLIDRDMATLSAYRRYLQADQLTVEYALSASAAMRRILADDPPDIAVCDAFMSELSGMDLYRRALTSASSWRQRMVLTADVQVSATASAFAEFKGQILTKPVSAQALRNAVLACLAQSAAGLPSRLSAT